LFTIDDLLLFPVTCTIVDCENDGSCVGGFCHCTTGFKGRYCEQAAVVDCSSNPCDRGGKCTDVSQGVYTCDCTGTGAFGSTCNIVIAALVTLPGAIILAIVISLGLRCRYPKAQNWVVLQVVLTLYDFATDIAFVYYQATVGGAIFYCALVFLLVPIVFNFGVIAKIFWSSVKQNASMGLWLRDHYTAAAIVSLLACSNIEVFSLLHSQLFYHHTFSAPLNTGTQRTLVIAGFVGSVLEDIPQLVIQSIAASSNLNTVTALSIGASVLAICFAIVKRALMFLVAKVGDSRSRKLLDIDDDDGVEAGSDLNAVYTNFDDMS